MKPHEHRIHICMRDYPAASAAITSWRLLQQTSPAWMSVTESRLTVSRGRLGFELIFFFNRGLDLYISDSVLCIAQAAGLSLRIHTNSLCELLSYRYSSGERTLFDDIHQIPAGYKYDFVPVADRWEISSNRSGFFSFSPDSAIADISRFQERFSDLFLSSVASFNGSVKSIFFSGGVDSSLLAVVMKPMVTGYCAGVDDPRYDESSYALTAGKDIDIDVCITRISTLNFIESIRAVIERTEQALPVIQLSMYNHLMQSSSIPAGSIVAGYGADYLLGESQRKYWAALRRGLCIPDCLLRLGDRMLSFSGEKRREQAQKISRFIVGIKTGQTWNSLFPDLDPPSSPEVSARALGLLTVPDIHAHRRRLLSDESPEYITQQVFVTYSNLISATLSTWSALCRSYDLDLSTPFLSTGLVDMVTSSHPGIYLSLTSGKPAISELARRLLPKQLIDRPKKSSLLPPEFWLNDGTPGLLDIFSDIKARNIIDIDYLVTREGAFSRYGYIPVWSAINFELLLQHYENMGLVLQ